MYWNGAVVGQHLGGYDAFSVDVSSGVKATSNELVLAVYDPSDKGYQGEWCTVLPEYSFLIYY